MPCLNITILSPVVNSFEKTARWSVFQGPRLSWLSVFNDPRPHQPIHFQRVPVTKCEDGKCLSLLSYSTTHTPAILSGYLQPLSDTLFSHAIKSCQCSAKLCAIFPSSGPSGAVLCFFEVTQTSCLRHACFFVFVWTS